MRAIPMNSESTVGNPPHGIPLGVSLDDDQGTESTEVATPPPTLAEDMADGDHHAQHPDIERAQEQENTNSGIPPESINSATIDGEHISRRSSVGNIQGTDPIHPVQLVPPDQVRESAGTPKPANSTSGCNASGLAAEECSVASNIVLDFFSSFLPSWKIIGVHKDNGFLDVHLRIPNTGPRKRSAPESEPPSNDRPGEDSGRSSKRMRWADNRIGS
ncbi:hypothetical protein KXV92_007210 [Aspergillus fumigatus]|nr:hypothetical protein KXV92_007210 [Aspergillus fumigatus]